MTLDKAIKHKKEFRKSYQKSKRFYTSCRNHGSCPYCRSNRLYKTLKRQNYVFDD